MKVCRGGHLRKAIFQAPALGVRGLTLVEVVVAIAVVAIFMASLFAMNSQMMLVIRSAKNQSAAIRSLKERTEQFRIAGWTAVTSPESLRLIIEEPTQPERSGWTATVSDPVETVTVTEVDPATMMDRNANIMVQKKDGKTVVSSAGEVANADLIRADFELAWTEGTRTVAPRRISAMLSPGGMMSASIGKNPFIPADTYTKPASLGGVRPPITLPADPVTVSEVPTLPGAEPSPQPVASPTPSPTPGKRFCKHGRPWPHCGIELPLP